MGLSRLTLATYGRCRDVVIDVGPGLTVVLGANEAGKSTALAALGDLFWGIPLRTPLGAEVGRAQLRIDAELELGGTGFAVSRRANGLIDLHTEAQIRSPWDPDETLDRQWWRSRLGIDHADLVRGGTEVFDGTGDIAELIFAARQGRSARELLGTISGQIDKLYKAHRNSRNVLLRVATRKYNEAVEDRNGRLTRADAVVDQQHLVEELDRQRGAARTELADANRLLRRAEEDRRVIGAVLELRQAQAQLAALAEEGDRLAEAELAEYDSATAVLADITRRLQDLDVEIADRTEAIEQLAVDDRLLAEQATLNRLQADAKARIEELGRADGELHREVSDQTRALRAVLTAIGVEIDTGADVDAALAEVRVRADQAATIDDLADRIEDWEAQRQQARAEHTRVLAELAAKGIRIEPDRIGTAPGIDTVAELRDAIGAARTARATAARLLTSADAALDELRAQAPTPSVAAELSRADVLAHRATRDDAWAALRRLWLTGELPAPGVRVDAADELDRLLERADRVADDEAEQRSRIAAQDARIGAHVEGLEAAGRVRQSAEEDLAAAAEEYRRLEGRWAALWTEFGLAEVPAVDGGLAVAELLLAGEAAQVRDAAAGAHLDESAGRWRLAAEAVGLPADSGTAAWRRRSEKLAEAEAIQARRVDAREHEQQARQRWAEFIAEVDGLVHRHGGNADGAPLTPAVVEHELSALATRLTAALQAAAARDAHRAELVNTDAERKAVVQAEHDATGALQRLAGAHRVEVGPDLDALAERAERAVKPQAVCERALREIAGGLDKGSDPADVVERLAHADQVSVEQAVEDAQVEAEAAAAAAEEVGDRLTTERDRLTVLLHAAGAADAEAEVAARQGDVAGLTESWAVLMLQRKLLEDVLAGLGADETQPLVEHAGRILERLTDGRWVALRADEDNGARRLEVVRADGARAGTAELSEGTADQVFLALRLAAVAELHAERTQLEAPALPLVLDDVLMTFDEPRTAGALQVLAELAPGLQVIVFTHHRHVAEAAGELDGVTVSELPPAAMIAEARPGAEVRSRLQEGVQTLTANRPTTGGADGPAPKEVREWAQRNGIEVNAKGRLPQEIVERYLAAHP